MIGRTLGNYRIIEQIGIGGMATVYKAYDPDTDRYVAIKVLPEHFSKDPKFRQRFEREAKAIAKLEHIHILPLFAYGEDEGVAYMVMRYLDAGSLTERIKQGSLPLAEASRLLSQIASALDHAHAHGVLHRDVKPSNVLLDSSGNAFLMDFGIAKMVESTLDLTGAGILGTPAYMSPEQCRGAELTSASDQYSLGIILYEMVTGRTPFRAETPIALIHMQLNEPLPLPRQVMPGLPEEAERVLLKALTKDPSLRFPTCGEMAAAFARAVASVTVEQPVDDLTIASVAPTAVTTPGVEEATVLPGPAEQVEAAPRPRRRLSAWALGLMAVLVVVGLAAVAIVAGLRVFGEEEEGPPSVAEGPSGTEGLSGAEVGEIGEQFWDFESGDAQDWALDDQGWQVIEAEGGYVLEGRASEAEDPGPPIPAYPPGLVNYENFHLAFDLKYVTDGMPNVFFRDRSGTSNCFFYDLILPPQSAEIWKQAGPCGPPDLVLDEAPTPTGFNTWHTVELLAVGGRLEVVIDEQEVLSLEDDEPLPAGGLYFGASGSPGSTFYIDNVHIIPFAAEEEMVQAQSPPESGPVVDIEPPTDSREVESCDWRGHGSGLCIYAPPREEPIQRILQDAGLDLMGWASWSPDGQQIAFSAVEAGGSPDQNAIHIVNADGTDLIKLPRISNEHSPAWSPDGEWLAFHSGCDLSVMHPDGSDPNIIWSEEDKCAENPQWSPDSQSIIVSMLEGRIKRIFPLERKILIVSLEGDAFPIATIAHQNEDCFIPEVAFSPDGKQVAYIDENCQPYLANADGFGQAEPLGHFPYWWTTMTHPQWGEGEAPPIVEPAPATGVEAFHEDFNGQTLEPSRWEPDGYLDKHTGFLEDGKFRVEVENDLSEPWDGELRARLSAPIKSIEFEIGLDKAEGDAVGFGVYFVDPVERERRRVLLNAGGDVLIQEGKERVIEISRAKSPLPLQYHIKLNWEEGKLFIYVDGEPVGKMEVLDFAREVGFWGHLDPGDKMMGYLDDVHIVYVAEDEIFEPAAPQPVSGEPFEAKFVEQCPDKKPPQICIIDAETQQTTQATGDLEFESIAWLVWSPDGQQIVFDAGSEPETGRFDHKLYLINADGSGLKQLTSGDTNDIFPAWSPDGKLIAFHRNCSLWVVRPDGSQPRELLGGTDKFCASTIEWSPDSQRIAFLNKTDDETVPYQVFVLDPGETVPRLIQAFDRSQEPHSMSWSRDGRQLALWFGEPDQEEVFLINADGSGEPKLMDEHLMEAERVWTWLPFFWPQWGGE
jgi:Tol biopolymer transport system component/predicted Ser/Thr protein kinase